MGQDAPVWTETGGSIVIPRMLTWLKVDDRVPLLCTALALVLAFTVIFAPLPDWALVGLFALVLVLAAAGALDFLLRPREQGRGRHTRTSPLTTWRKP
jgi:hypothetical protein